MLFIENLFGLKFKSLCNLKYILFLMITFEISLVQLFNYVCSVSTFTQINSNCYFFFKYLYIMHIFSNYTTQLLFIPLLWA